MLTRKLINLLINNLKTHSILLILLFLGPNYIKASANTNNLPGSIDSGRLNLDKPETDLHSKIEQEDTTTPSYASEVPIPKDADKIKLKLNAIKINGMTVFSTAQVEHTYLNYLKKEISLADAYRIAKKITELYRAQGYFLSIAYLPEQRINKGTVIIQIVEGYIGAIEIPEQFKEVKFITNYINKIKQQKPLQLKNLESFLLTLKGLYSYSFNGTLSPLTDNKEAKNGAVMLTLTAEKKTAKGELVTDNFLSRFLGPEQGSIFHSQSLFLFQKTSIFASNSRQLKNMRYIMGNHAINIIPNLVWEFNGNFSRTTPGFNLKYLEIKSKSKNLITSLDYQLIRQRQRNLNLKLSIISRDSITWIYNMLFTKDNIRAVKFSTTYDNLDNDNNYARVGAAIIQGISGLGSSKSKARNISRSLAKPNFSKLELSFLYLYKITNNWLLQFNTASQYAGSSLYSSEEFGYGGQAYGKAFDSSDLTGDHGIAGLLELTYTGFKTKNSTIFPYVFYDVGKIWTRDSTRKTRNNIGSSSGFGCYYSVKSILSGQIGLAWPLKREINTPIYGGSKRKARFLFKLSFSY